MKTNTHRYRRLLETEGDDPLAGVANLFDIAMVFAVALLIALVSRLPQQRNPSELSASGQIPIEGESLKRYQIGESQIGGQGKQLGMAYQLESGEVIYVPQE